MNIGIDKIGFATSQYVLKMEDLALARSTDPAKFHQGLMLDALSIAPVTEDIVTLAASAADQILTKDDKASIDMVILATESSIDQSKAASIYVHQLLDIQPFARSFEIKEACYSATAALDYAKLHVAAHPASKVLVIASDIAKYGIGSAGEPTQGAGSIAMLVTTNPRILQLNHDNVAQTRDVMDFWRPNYSSTPFVNGIYSTKQYLDSLKTTWDKYQEKEGIELSDLAAICFHIPFPKLALKGLHKIMTKSLLADNHKEKLYENFQASIAYSKQIGNIYTGSLYLGLLSLLENSQVLRAGDRIGLFSYGSGAVSELFSGQLVDGYKDMLLTNRQALLDQRQVISVADYEALFYEEPRLDQDGNASFSPYLTGRFALKEIKEHQRIYQDDDKN
ncbi:TPA: hydroxymethylglutaryl-CoA synthase [Streptococcus equi subsp. zooepidemicus]|nr:hydroxymethylglutaryl-CoA synthase [Streptococcus equi]MCD3368058.1 hydroxymethylglutaryl-CoA synthase [Streptococcus equi subsp. zooepidemicus]MCD3373921.1 hydroxymethylglutaryl-CoA synthase [Streptococcus equi subsp. zooepidemicus]MCD3394442.1 hydroxymethylglutaryl-CoA synthase [Streptococcus equi subsp. zooepidemicus]MCD3449991.1 hydroxymethylglutaryl-CoA synthase [Streptococcus equi subsp. zooepidemicus]MCD3459771.1 hydroxymethylglutaryl-CoA synthase [Streptococcus equi subsp. zooepidem